MRRKILILVALLGVMLVLTGCGVNREGVDVMTTDPQGPWQFLIVWPLTKALIWIESFLQGFNVPYSWGFAIVLFTVFIKLVTFPLTMTQIKGMMAQRELQPKLEELKKKHGKNREKMAEAQMKLYQEAGVNPLSGCLPLIVQMPILFGLYSALIALGDRLEGAHFFWIPNLAYPEFTQGMGWILELFQNGEYLLLGSYLVLPILLMVSQVLMQRYMTMTPPTTGDDNGGQAGMMKQMTTMMTLMFGFFTLQVPAGLTLYWVTSNLLQIAQQYSIMKVQEPAAATVGGGSTTLATASNTGASTSSNGTSKESSSNGTSSSDTKTKRSRRQRKRK